MKKYVNIILISLFGLLFTTCNQNIGGEDIQEIGIKKDIFIDIPDTAKSINMSKALIVAQNFNQLNTTRSVSEVKKIDKIEIYKNSKNESLFYIINYMGHNGFVLISATKHTSPILAYSDTGSFTLDSLKRTGLELWINGIEHEIGNARKDTTSIVHHAVEWSRLLTHKVSLSQTRAYDYISEEDQSYIENCISEWQNEGYTVYRVKDVELGSMSSIPSALDQAILELKNNPQESTFGRPLYMDSYILEKTEIYNTLIRPLIKTKWDQGWPYNKCLSNVFAPLGCTTVAVGQILNYYANISSFDFNKINNPQLDGFWECSSFLTSVGRILQIDYDHGDYNASLGDILNAFNYYNYSYSVDVQGKLSDIESCVSNGYPILMTGYNSSDVGHAWVCDGYGRSEGDVHYKVVVPMGMPIDIDGVFLDYATYTQTYPKIHSVHYNWGWGGDNDGYFYLKGVFLGAEQADFNRNRKQIMSIKPKN